MEGKTTMDKLELSCQPGDREKLSHPCSVSLPSLYSSTSGLMASTKQQTKTLETCWNQVLPLHHRLLKVTTSAFVHVRNIQMSVPSPATMHFQESETYVGKCTGSLSWPSPVPLSTGAMAYPYVTLTRFQMLIWALSTDALVSATTSSEVIITIAFSFFYSRENWGPREIKWLATQLKSDEN